MSLAYDALSRRTSLTLPNGTSTSYTYDAASQVQSILHKITATNTPINNADYLYNPVGDRTQLTDRRGVQSFGYDNLDRLTSASHPLLGTPQAFSYDAVGNRITVGNVTNAGNQLTTDATHSYQYDDNGNLTRKTLLATGNYTQYTYDAENRLTKVEDFAAGASTPAATSTYRYDGLGRRIEKIGNGITRRYIYDGEDMLLEYDGANVLQARYTQGPGIDEPLGRTPMAPGVGSGHTAILASTADGSRGPIVDDGISVNGQVSVGFVLVSGVPTPAIGQPIDATGSHQPVPPIDVTAAAAGGTLAVDLIDSGGIGGSAPLYLVTKDTATNQVLSSTLLFPAKPTFASTTPFGVQQVVASTTVPVNTAVANGTVYYHQDGLRTVTDLTDGSGTIVQSYSYDAYGNILDSAGSIDQPYTYTGRELDQETAFYYFRSRYYDPRIGRFLQVDPTGLAGGLNVYAYVGGNPLMYIDPLGLWSPGGHDLIFDYSFNGRLSRGDIQRMQQASREFDKRTQDAGLAYMHCMRVNGQSASYATSLHDRFVMDRLDEAKSLARGGNRGSALDKFAEACHAVTDCSSPEHTTLEGEPKVWNPWWPFGHSPNDRIGNETVYDLNQNILDSQSRKLNQMYNQVFGK